MTLIDAVQPDLTGKLPDPPPERTIGDVPISEIPAKAYRIVHEGDPMPWPRSGEAIRYRKDGTPYIAHFTPTPAKHRMAEIALAWQSARFPCFPKGVPLAIGLRFVFARPDGHFGTGANRFTIKPRFEHVRPGKGGNSNTRGQRTGGDLDNLEKIVLDALSDVAFADDGQIAHTDHREKVYLDQAEDGGLEPRTIVTVRALLPREPDAMRRGGTDGS